MPKVYHDKPFAPASEQNKEPILAVLRQLLTQSSLILEIGSGTGQHAVHFAHQLPHLVWQTSDLPEQLPGIRLWLEEARQDNLPAPLELDVCDSVWPISQVDGVFTANTVHIMAWPQVQAMYAGVGAVLKVGGLFCLYGPINYHGRYTSDSNARFDEWLKSQDPRSGIRDFDDLDRLAQDHGLAHYQDHAMPVNNRLLVWRKRESD